MSAEIERDPYEVVLADLRAKRDEIDRTIETLSALSGTARAAQPQVAHGAIPPIPAPQDGPGAFLGMSISDAAKKALGAQRRPLGNIEIAKMLKDGGLHMNSAEPANTVGSVLSRRFQQIGDIVKVGRGMWGLKEWYPNQTFKTQRGAPPVEPVDAWLDAQLDQVVEEDLIG